MPVLCCPDCCVATEVMTGAVMTKVSGDETAWPGDGGVAWP